MVPQEPAYQWDCGSSDQSSRVEGKSISVDNKSAGVDEVKSIGGGGESKSIDEEKSIDEVRSIDTSQQLHQVNALSNQSSIHTISKPIGDQTFNFQNKSFREIYNMSLKDN